MWVWSPKRESSQSSMRVFAPISTSSPNSALPVTVAFSPSSKESPARPPKVAPFSISAPEPISAPRRMVTFLPREEPSPMTASSPIFEPASIYASSSIRAPLPMVTFLPTWTPSPRTARSESFDPSPTMVSRPREDPASTVTPSPT